MGGGGGGAWEGGGEGKEQISLHQCIPASTMYFRTPVTHKFKNIAVPYYLENTQALYLSGYSPIKQQCMYVQITLN